MPFKKWKFDKNNGKTKMANGIVTATTAVCVFADISIDNSKQNNVPIYPDTIVSKYNCI